MGEINLLGKVSWVASATVLALLIVALTVLVFVVVHSKEMATIEAASGKILGFIRTSGNGMSYRNSMSFPAVFISSS
ncbi:hypothetical protein [Cohnella abietis]|nr:hypothetical protein [Cohnella abietis]